MSCRIPCFARSAGGGIVASTLGPAGPRAGGDRPFSLLLPLCRAAEAVGPWLRCLTDMAACVAAVACDASIDTESSPARAKPSGPPGAGANAGVAPLFFLPDDKAGRNYFKFSMVLAEPRWVETGISDPAKLPVDAVLLPNLVASIAGNYDAVLGTALQPGTSLQQFAARFKDLPSLRGPVLYIGTLSSATVAAGAGAAAGATTSSNSAWLAEAGVVFLMYVPCNTDSKYLIFIDRKSSGASVSNLGNQLRTWHSRNKDTGTATATFSAAGLSVGFSWIGAAFVRCIGDTGQCEAVRGAEDRMARLRAVLPCASGRSRDVAPAGVGSASAARSDDDAGERSEDSSEGDGDAFPNLLARPVRAPPAKRLRTQKVEPLAMENLWEMALRAQPHSYSSEHDVVFLPVITAVVSSRSPAPPIGTATPASNAAEPARGGDV